MSVKHKRLFFVIYKEANKLTVIKMKSFGFFVEHLESIWRKTCEVLVPFPADSSSNLQTHKNFVLLFFFCLQKNLQRLWTAPLFLYFRPLIFWISLELRISMPFLKRPTWPDAEAAEPEPAAPFFFFSLKEAVRVKDTNFCS